MSTVGQLLVLNNYLISPTCPLHALHHRPTAMLRPAFSIINIYFNN